MSEEARSERPQVTAIGYSIPCDERSRDSRRPDGPAPMIATWVRAIPSYLRLKPRRVSGLAMLNTGIHAVRDGEPQSRGLLLRLAYQHGMSALAAEWLPSMMAGGSRTQELMPSLKAMVERSTPDSYAGQINALLHRPEALSVLPTIGVPTLLLSGSEDAWAPVSQHETTRRRIPHPTVFEIHGAGHMAPIERPDAVAVAMREWLEAI